MRGMNTISGGGSFRLLKMKSRAMMTAAPSCPGPSLLFVIGQVRPSRSGPLVTSCALP
jgi:hypothetical protein